MTSSLTGAHQRQVAAAGGHLDAAQRLLSRVNEALDDYWEQQHPTARDAALDHLTALERAATQAKYALAPETEALL